MIDVKEILKKSIEEDLSKKGVVLEKSKAYVTEQVRAIIKNKGVENAFKEFTYQLLLEIPSNLKSDILQKIKF